MTDKTMTLDEFTKEIELRHAVVRALERMDHDDPQGVRLIREHLLHLDNQIDAITRHLSQPAERGEAVAKAFCFMPSHIVDSVNANLRKGSEAVFTAYTAQHDPLDVPLYTAPPPAAGVPDGTWIWGKLMDWCKARGYAPAAMSDLFAIAGEAHKLSVTPSPIIDVAAVRDVISAMKAGREYHARHGAGGFYTAWIDELERAIGDAK